MTNQVTTVQISLLHILSATTTMIHSQSPGAICVQASGEGQLSPMPNSYKLWYRQPNSEECLTVVATQNTTTGQVTWGQIMTTPPILGVGGNLDVCTVDSYGAYTAIGKAGYTNPVFFCGLFQAVVPHIYQPWYCFTPNNCASSSSSNYIFVNAVTAEVRLFPTDAEYQVN